VQYEKSADKHERNQGVGSYRAAGKGGHRKELRLVDPCPIHQNEVRAGPLPGYRSVNAMFAQYRAIETKQIEVVRRGTVNEKQFDMLVDKVCQVSWL
jgi:hypothetical protein